MKQKKKTMKFSDGNAKLKRNTSNYNRYSLTVEFQWWWWIRTLMWRFCL